MAKTTTTTITAAKFVSERIKKSRVKEEDEEVAERGATAEKEM